MGIHREIEKEKHAIHEGAKKWSQSVRHRFHGNFTAPLIHYILESSFCCCLYVFFFFLLQYILSATMCSCPIYCLVTWAPGSPRGCSFGLQSSPITGSLCLHLNKKEKPVCRPWHCSKKVQTSLEGRFKQSWAEAGGRRLTLTVIAQLFRQC